MFRKATAIIILVSLSLGLSACQSESGLMRSVSENDSVTGDSVDDLNYDIVDKGPVRGGTLSVFTTPPDTLNPVLTNNTYVSDFLSFIYEGLVKLDEKGQPLPELSDSWSVTPDGLVWDFHIRDGVKWQDGTPFKAEDVEYTVGYILNSKVASNYKSLLENITTFSAIDQSDFRLLLRKPNSFMPECMTFPILPKHLAEKSDAAPGSDIAPVGTGPYKFSSKDTKKIVLVADEDWWYLKTVPEKADSMMYINEIDIKLYPSAEDEMSAFQTGDIDVACINTSDFGRYMDRTDLTLHKYISRDYDFLTFNLGSALFSDKSARNAVASAIDINQVISSVFRGSASAADIPVMPGSWILDTANPSSQFPQKAKDILTAGGWKNDAAGFYKTIMGTRKYLGFEILVNSNNQSRVNAVQKICEQLNAAGIKAACTSLDWNELNSRVASRKFDVVCQGVTTSRIPDLSYMYSNSYLNTFTAQIPGAARNTSGYSSTAANNFISSMFSLNSRDARKNALSGLKALVDSDSPYVGLYFLQNAVIYRKDLRGSLSPYAWNKYYDITKWYKTELQ